MFQMERAAPRRRRGDNGEYWRRAFFVFSTCTYSAQQDPLYVLGTAAIKATIKAIITDAEEPPKPQPANITC